jgi:outer membrane receptor protein involved in Fe transport
LNLTTFLSDYHGLQTNEPGVPVFVAGPAGPYFLLPTLFDDNARARNYGGEIFANWNVTPRWRISLGYSFLQMHVAGDPSTQEPDPGAIARETPLGESLELSVVGQNLLSPAHAEYHDAFTIFHSLAARSVFARVIWRF